MKITIIKKKNIGEASITDEVIIEDVTMISCVIDSIIKILNNKEVNETGNK
jgi:hypothetical protein